MSDQDIAAALAGVTAALPGGGEQRSGQLEMAEAVGRAIDSGRHLVVQAGTGTGKSLAYVVPAVLSGRKVVVATATKALQDQLAEKDLPSVAAALRPALLLRRAEGPEQLPLPPAGGRDRRPGGPAAARRGVTPRRRGGRARATTA